MQLTTAEEIERFLDEIGDENEAGRAAELRPTRAPLRGGGRRDRRRSPGGPLWYSGGEPLLAPLGPAPCPSDDCPLPAVTAPKRRARGFPAELDAGPSSSLGRGGRGPRLRPREPRGRHAPRRAPLPLAGQGDAGARDVADARRSKGSRTTPSHRFCTGPRWRACDCLARTSGRPGFRWRCVPSSWRCVAGRLARRFGGEPAFSPGRPSRRHLPRSVALWPADDDGRAAGAGGGARRRGGLGGRRRGTAPTPPRRRFGRGSLGAVEGPGGPAAGVFHRRGAGGGARPGASAERLVSGRGGPGASGECPVVCDHGRASWDALPHPLHPGGEFRKVFRPLDIGRRGLAAPRPAPSGAALGGARPVAQGAPGAEASERSVAVGGAPRLLAPRPEAVALRRPLPRPVAAPGGGAGAAAAHGGSGHGGASRRCGRGGGARAARPVSASPSGSAFSVPRCCSGQPASPCGARAPRRRRWASEAPRCWCWRWCFRRSTPRRCRSRPGRRPGKGRWSSSVRTRACTSCSPRGECAG